MLKSRKELESAISFLLEPYTLNVSKGQEEIEEFRSLMLKKYNLPEGIIMDCVHNRMSSSAITDFVLFCIMKEIKSEEIPAYFTNLEIGSYSKMKWEDPYKVVLPLRIPCFEINNSQWIGIIDANLLYSMKKQQIIKYNKDTQRVLKKTVNKSGEVIYKINLNTKSVSDIEKLMKTNQFISNTITLNIGNNDIEFFYDDSNKELVITTISMLDIIDGYHRFVAICNQKEKNPDFNYPMEIRIVNFTEEKARQFIWQEDQKNKMKKIDSETMNTNSDINIIIERLNSDMNSDVREMIARSESVINYGILASYLNLLYKKNLESEKNNNKKVTLRLTYLRKTKEILNYLISEYPDEFSKQLDDVLLFGSLIVSAYDLNYVKCIAYLYNNLETIKNKLAKNIASKKNLETMLDIFKEIK